MTDKPPGFSSRQAPMALLALCLVSYLPLIYRLGFYWDDWPSIWFYHLWGPNGYLQSFASDRPSLAWVFMLTTSLLGESTVGWQIFGLLTRWLASLTFRWLLLGVWPHYKPQVFAAAALFAVYPGFSQQYIAVTYSNAFLVMTLALFSLGSMVWALRLPRWRWPLLAASLLAQAASLAMTEYFYGWEALRPLLLWLAQHPTDEKKPRARPRDTLWRWAPHLLVGLPFFIDRLFFHKTPRGEITLFNQFFANPAAALSDLLQTLITDFFEVNFLAWFRRLDLRFIFGFEQTILAWFLAVVVGGGLLTFIYLMKQQDESSNSQRKGERPNPIRWAMQALLIGGYAFFVSGWTIWATNLHIELIFPWDRFTLILMPGSALLTSGLIALLTRRRWQSALLLATIIGLAAGLQFQHRLVYRQEWLSQRNFLWQLAWRAPAIQPGSVLLTSELPFTFYSDNSLSAPLNWMYAPENRSQDMQYLLYDVEARLGIDLPAIEADQEIRTRYRATLFQGSTSQAIVVFYDPPRCVKVIDPAVDRFLPVKPLYIREMTPLSQPSLIQPYAEPSAAPPQHVLGPEPPPSWCYYFEKAELYGQSGEWEAAAKAADQALKINKHFTEKNVSELFPFIEAFARTDRWQEAVELSLKAYQIWDKTQYPLCDYWARIAENTIASPDQHTAIQKIKESLQCNLP
jgi:tetratricopeptide (TPR) repeat protein